MATFVVLPIASELASRARTTRRSPQYGHPAHQEVAGGTGPCRQCLRGFTVGAEERLLFTYSPFDGEALRQPGPIFIHADACEAHGGMGYPDGLRDLPIVVQAYHHDGSIAAPARLPRDEQALTLAGLFDDPQVDFAQLRHAEAGCFIARVERRTEGQA